MAVPVIMPRQGQSVESCILTEWLKRPGDQVSKGDILFSYETDKASFETEAEEDGILLAVFAEEGDEIPVLQNVAVIGQQGESVDEFKPGGESSSEEAVVEEKQQIQEPEKTAPKEQAQVSTSQQSGGKIKISPRAKNLANKEGVEADKLPGTGPQGRIIERDVVAQLNQTEKLTPLAKEKRKAEDLTAPEKGTGIGERISAYDLTSTNQAYAGDFEVKKLSNVRKIIAKAMHASLQNSAQLTHHMSADVRKLLAFRAQVKAAIKDGYQYNITLNDMVCYAVIKALKKHPEANSHFLGDSIRTFNKVHLGFAVDTPRGLMVPTVKNADDLSITGLSSQLKSLAEQCKSGNIDPELISSTAASFTVSNLGAYGVEIFTPVINLPQAGILGVNTIIKRPAELENGMFGFVPYMGLSLTYDHRSLDGGPASLFLKEIKTEIEKFNVSL